MDNAELVQIENSLRQKSIEELLFIWTENKRHDWSPGSFDVVKKILIEKGVKVPRQKTAEDSITNADFCKDVGIRFFPTSIKKLTIMSLCTFGIYEIFWFYKNWKFLKQKHDFKINPFWRAWFAIFFCHSFFKIVKEYSKQHQLETDYKPGKLTLAYILLYIFHQIPWPASLISMLTFIPLLSAQRVINGLNDRLAPGSDINDKFSGWNILVIILALIFWLLVILGTMLPAGIK